MGCPDVRLFFALWPDARTRALIADAASAIRVCGPARLVPRENYHLTLAFVGEATLPQLAVLQQIGRDQRAAGCTIKVEALDYWREPQVVVAVARETPPALDGLCMRLHQDLALRDVAGPPLAPPAALLRAHVTLARKVAQAPVLQAMSPFHWNARSFSLVRSDTSGPHAVYTVVDTWPLLDETPRP